MPNLLYSMLCQPTFATCINIQFIIFIFIYHNITSSTRHTLLYNCPSLLPAGFEYSHIDYYIHIYIAVLHIQSRSCTILQLFVRKFLLRVVRDVDKAENGCAVTLIIVQLYAEELETDILEQG